MIDSRDNIEIGETVLGLMERTEYNVKLYGYYEYDETHSVYTGLEEDDLEKISEEEIYEIISLEIDDDTVDLVTSINGVEFKGRTGYAEVHITREKYFCISDSFSVKDRNEDPEINEGFLKDMLRENKIDPNLVTRVHTCAVDSKTKFKELM